MALPVFPLINGNRYDYTSVEIMIEGVPYRGVKSVDYGDSTDGQKQWGTSVRPLGRMRGKYDADASLEVFKEDAVIIRKALGILGGGGWGEANFTVTVTYGELGTGYTTDVLFGCRVLKVQDSHAQGADGITEKWDLSVMEITRDGQSLLAPLTYVK